MADEKKNVSKPFTPAGRSRLVTDEPEAGSVPKEKNDDINEGAGVDAQNESLELSKKEKEIEELRKLTFELQSKVDEFESEKKRSSMFKKTDKEAAFIDTLQEQVQTLNAQVNLLSRQSFGSQGKVLFREPVASDTQDDSVTFTARSVLYVVASYRNHKGIEVIPPHKLIVFQYAASDIRKDGREEEIRNFSQYTTNLKTEIEFLRNHPFYGITFSENVNAMMEEDVVQIRFKSQAANQIAALPPEAIFERAKDYKIPGFHDKSPNQLRALIVERMASDFKKDEEDRHAEMAKRRVMALQSMTFEE